MNLNLILAASSLLATTTMACGYSPLLNHNQKTANAAPPTVSRETQPHDCQLAFAKSGLCASIAWDTALSSDAENRGTVRFWDPSTGGASGPYRDAQADVAVMLWMPAMGHGSAKVAVSAQGGGTYSISNVYFIMPGAWEVHVQLKHGQQLIEEAVLPVTL